MTNPKRGEIWTVDFNPTIGAEIKKIRPAIVISSDAVGLLPLKLVMPVTEWNIKFQRNIWHVQIKPSNLNGLSKESAADALQTRSVSIERFNKNLGRITESQIEEIIQALAAVIELT